MNTYKITFQRENGTTATDNFVAATEAQARKDFKEVYRYGNRKITNVELISSDTLATKEQERKAVEKIRKIVSELGDNSYVGIALEGCLDDAESNIENDIGNSMKCRYENAEKKLSAAQKEINRLYTQIKIAELNERDLCEAIKKIKSEDSKTITDLREHILSFDDLSDIIQLLSEKRFALDTDVKNAAEKIVETAEDPESVAFKNAVSEHRTAKANLEYYIALLSRVSEAKGKFF